MLDPTATVGLQSMDFGSVYSPDGREHPLLALTPISFATQGPDQGPAKPRTGSDPVYAPDPADPTSVGNAVGMGTFNPFHFPPHFGARVAVSVIAIAILLIVVARLLLK